MCVVCIREQYLRPIFALYSAILLAQAPDDPSEGPGARLPVQGINSGCESANRLPVSWYLKGAFEHLVPSGHPPRHL